MSEETDQEHHARMVAEFEAAKKRDRFEAAKAAMEGLLSNRGIVDDLGPHTYTWVAERAVEQADALLLALEES